MNKDNETGASSANSESDSGDKGIFGSIGDAISGVITGIGNLGKSTSDETPDSTASAQDSGQGTVLGSSDSGSWPSDISAASATGSNASTDSSDSSSAGGSGSMGADASATSVVDEEPFVGTGGVGSPEFYENLRKAHEAASDDYNSDLGDPNRSS